MAIAMILYLQDIKWIKFKVKSKKKKKKKKKKKISLLNPAIL